MTPISKLLLLSSSRSSSPRLDAPTHPSESFARTLMSDSDFLSYIDHHGYHFTPALSDYVTSHFLKNEDGSTHHWTTEQVKTAMETAGMKENRTHATWGDAAYLANWFYSDAYPEFMPTEQSLIKRTYRAINDIDGYEGMTFSRWLSDVVGHRLSIDWALFI